MLCNCTVELSGNSSRGDHWSHLGKVMHTFFFLFFNHTVAFKGRVDAPLFVQIKYVKVVTMGVGLRPLNRTQQIWKLLLQTPYYILFHFRFSSGLQWKSTALCIFQKIQKIVFRKDLALFLDCCRKTFSASSLGNNRDESHKHYTYYHYYTLYILGCPCGGTEQSFRLPDGYESIYLKGKSMKGFVYV